MAGAVGSSSMAGMAASVHNILRVRASKGSWMITQHDESQKKKCRGERMRDRRRKDLSTRKKAIRRGEEKERDILLSS